MPKDRAAEPAAPVILGKAVQVELMQDSGILRIENALAGNGQNADKTGKGPSAYQSVRSPEELAVVAAQDFVSELIRLGYRLAAPEVPPERLIRLLIGEARFEAGVGWISDRVIAEVTRPGPDSTMQPFQLQPANPRQTVHTTMQELALLLQKHL